MRKPKPPLMVPAEQAKAVFDVAVNSMDFGSGMLDHEDVGHLRAFARLIKVDPMNATPHNFRTQYAHAYKPETVYKGRADEHERCGWCYRQKDWPCHKGEGRS